MGQRTKIEYVHHTWNPIRGCEHALLPDGSEHPGCAHCYAEAMSKRNPKVLGTWGSEEEGGVRTVAAPGYWGLLRQWNAAARKAQERRRVMVSLFDPFEAWDRPMHSHRGRQLMVSDEEPLRWLEWPDDGVEGMLPIERQNVESGVFRPLGFDDVRSRMFDEIDRGEWLDVLLFTKRAQLIREWWPEKPPHLMRTPCDVDYRFNAWLIYSASDTATLLAGWPDMAECRSYASVLGLSLEPLLGPVDLRWMRTADSDRVPDWITVGGESGPHARPCRLEWIRDIIAECRFMGVPCYVKQWGANPLALADDDHDVRVPLTDPKGGDPDEWPADLRVQQFPRHYQKR
jgi:protein gp37